LFIASFLACGSKRPQDIIQKGLSKEGGIESITTIEGNIVTVDIVKFGKEKDVFKVSALVATYVGECIEKNLLPKAGSLFVNFPNKAADLSATLEDVLKFKKISESGDELKTRYSSMSIWKVIRKP
jgi:hypothetical protein